MANHDIFGIEKKKRRSGDVPELKPVKYRVDPFHIMPGDVERVKRQTNVERNTPEPPSEMPHNEVEGPKDEIRKKKEEE